MDHTVFPGTAPIRIVIGHTSGGLYWEGVNQLLKTVKEFRVIAVGSQDDVASVLEREQPHVLVMQVGRNALRESCQPFWSIVPGLAIIGLDPTGAEHVLQLHDLGRDLLIDIIRDIGAEATQSRQAAGHNFVLITDNGIESQGEPYEPMTAPPQLPSGPAPRWMTVEHLADFFLWLDLVLLGQLARDPARGCDEPLGWATTVEKARSLLGGDHYSDWTEQDLGRAREDLERRMQARADALTQLAPADQPKLIALRDIFSLDPLEWLMLMFALSVELDGRYARVFGFLNDDVSRKRPTASLIAHILPGDSLRAWRAQGLLQNGPLADYRLLSPDPEEATRLPGTEVGLVPAAELVAYVLAGDTHEPHYMAAIDVIGPPTPAAKRADNDPERALREKIKHCIDSPGQKPLIHLPGDTAQRCWFERLLGELGLTIVRLNGAALADEDSGRLAQAAIAAARVARLHDAALLMTGLSRLSSNVDAALLNDAAVNSVWSLVPLVATDGPLSLTDMAARGRTVWQIERPAPTARTRAALWFDEADRHGFTLAPADSAQIAQTLSFDTPQIAATLSLCGSPSEPGGALTLKSLKVAARQVARQSVPPLVRRIEAVFKKWDDIVLPEPVKNQLKQIPQHVSHAERVLQDWGFAARLPYGQGVAALFSGLSGTGKTMAAQIIAADLGVELFQVDLAKTASKYIGETEKNLDVIFEAAEQSSAVLLFDEADSLFGKRSEVKDAHDLYANFQVAYLLQRMEAYAGVAILTTNMKQNLDTGFIRRLRFFVEFPAPNAEEREAIWERSFPEATPGRNAVDFNALARRLAVTGGHIQQIAVRAAFAAAADKSGVTMRHIVEATHYELTKLGMLNVERNLADLAA